ncbi:MAG: LLM class flavin-dependent oxidoreductase, partial [Thermoleophilia bacterium]|nr:LLM class flavin-dependent oxidoreductase [Thermoleophilia bacterium]
YRSMQNDDPAGSLDAWTVLAGLAARTERLRLGTMVSPVTFRPAAVLAKSVVTVDHISNGRVELGIGAGWFEAEHATYGFDFMTTRERLDELDRQLEQIVRHWTSADDVWPKPMQQPRPPIIIGGTARPRTVRAAVRWADEYNTVFPTVEEARERKQTLDRAARAAGREPLRYSMMIGCAVARTAEELQRRLERHRSPPPISGTIDEVVEQLRAYERVGVERAMLQHLMHDDVEMVAVLGEVAARLR